MHSLEKRFTTGETQKLLRNAMATSSGNFPEPSSSHPDGRQLRSVNISKRDHSPLVASSLDHSLYDGWQHLARGHAVMVVLRPSVLTPPQGRKVVPLTLSYWLESNGSFQQFDHSPCSGWQGPSLSLWWQVASCKGQHRPSVLTPPIDRRRV